LLAVRLFDRAAMMELRRFGILADGRPIRVGGRGFDVLMTRIEASRAAVSGGAGPPSAAPIQLAVP